MSSERTYLCKQCRNLFKIISPGGSQPEKISCPRCGNTIIEEAPCWAPLGSGINIFESSEWEYECQQCHANFKLPIPRSPTEEKQRRCPHCGAGHLHRLTVAGGQPLYCG